MEKNPIVVHPTISSEAQTSPFEEAPYRTNRVGGIYLEQNHHLEDLTQEVSPLISLSPLIQLVEVEILQSKDYPNIHPLILNLFPVKPKDGIPLAGRVKYFTENWKRLTNDQAIIQLIGGYQIPFLSEPQQRLCPHPPNLNSEEKHLVNQEVSSMHDWMCKVDLKDAYFSVPIHKNFRKYLRFKWQGSTYQFLCLCFGLGPAPRLFTKLLKVPIALLRRLNVKIIIYLDDMLLMGASQPELMLGRDTLIFVLQHLGLVINLKKSVLTPTKKLEFLGVLIDSNKMDISLPEEKIVKIQNQCQTLLSQKTVSVRELTQLIGRLSSTVIAVLPAPL